MDAGILPVKGLKRAKARLAEHLGGSERAEVVEALLVDAFALCESATFLSWWVVSDDESVLGAAAERGFATVTDPGGGLNPALTAALDAVSRANASSATIVPCDVPLAWAGDLQDLLDTGATSDVVVVPSRDGGTNGLYLGPPDVMPPLFGAGSLRAHIEEAERRSVRCSILSLPRLELDIDTIEDVDAFLAKPKHAESRTNDVLVRLRKSARA